MKTESDIQSVHSGDFGVFKKTTIAVMLACGIGATGSAQAAINWVFDTTAPPTPTPCSISGSSYGNSVSCTSATAPTPQLTQATAWANTGGNSTASPNGTLESAYIANYSGGLGITNRDGANGTPVDPNEGTPGSSTPPEHGIDNNRNSTTTNLAPAQYTYDSVLLTFATAVTLTGVTIGWMDTDSDITVLAYQGAAGGQGLAGKTYAQLTTSGDWNLVGHYSDLVSNTVKTINDATGVNTPTGTSVSSQYWLISAYNPLVGLDGIAQMTTGNDYFKLLSVSGVKPGGKAPEPGSLALLGILAAGAVGVKRFKKKMRPAVS